LSFGPSQLAISSFLLPQPLLSSIGECSSLQLPFIGQAVRSANLFYSHLVAYQASSSHPAFTGKTTFRPPFYQFRGSSTIKLGRRHHWAIWLRGERLLVGKYDKRQKAARNAQPRSGVPPPTHPTPHGLTSIRRRGWGGGGGLGAVKV
jgi:hypothetical protein